MEAHILFKKQLQLQYGIISFLISGSSLPHRTMRSPEGELTFNFRPFQPPSDRIVSFNVADNMRRVPWAHNSAVSPFVTSFMLGKFLQQ